MLVHYKYTMKNSEGTISVRFPSGDFDKGETIFYQGKEYVIIRKEALQYEKTNLH